MPDLVVSNDIEIIAKVQKTAEILKIFKVHTYGETNSSHIRQLVKNKIKSLSSRTKLQSHFIRKKSTKAGFSPRFQNSVAKT